LRDALLLIAIVSCVLAALLSYKRGRLAERASNQAALQQCFTIVKARHDLIADVLVQMKKEHPELAEEYDARLKQTNREFKELSQILNKTR
jgi:hypothetical protein